MDITVTQKNVHSKKLFDTIDEHVRAVVMLLDLVSDMDGVIQLIEIVITEEAEDYKLEQINVVGDSRNNKISDLKNGKHVIDVYYRHKNCFNVTRLSYTLRR